MGETRDGREFGTNELPSKYKRMEMEIGKKYRNKLWVAENKSALCIGITSTGVPVLETKYGDIRLASDYLSDEWIEVWEPREYLLAVARNGKEIVPAFVYGDRLSEWTRFGYEVIKVKEIIE